MFKWGLIVILLLYVAVIISPLPKHIGRTHPSLAASLYPPLFNFSEHYERGNVYGFGISDDIEIAANHIENLGLEFVTFNNNCGMPERQSIDFVSFKSSKDLLVWGADRSVWCVHYDGVEVELYFEIYFSNQNIVKISMSKINFEGT